MKTSNRRTDDGSGKRLRRVDNKREISATRRRLRLDFVAEKFRFCETTTQGLCRLFISRKGILDGNGNNGARDSRVGFRDRIETFPALTPSFLFILQLLFTLSAILVKLVLFSFNAAIYAQAIQEENNAAA